MRNRKLVLSRYGLPDSVIPTHILHVYRDLFSNELRLFTKKRLAWIDKSNRFFIVKIDGHYRYEDGRRIYEKAKFYLYDVRTFERGEVMKEGAKQGKGFIASGEGVLSEAGKEQILSLIASITEKDELVKQEEFDNPFDKLQNAYDQKRKEETAGKQKTFMDKIKKPFIQIFSKYHRN